MSEEEMNKTDMPEDGLPISSQIDDSEVLEYEFNEDGEEDLKKTLKKFRTDLKASQKEKAEYLTGWQKERADFANYRKEEMERSKSTASYAQERVILDLLPALDSYDLAFSNKEAWEKVDKNWRQGVEYIHQQILKALGEYGVMPIEAKIGDAFDHNLHQSIETIATEDKNKDQTIAQVTQTGYKIDGRVIRPARVNIHEYHESGN